MAKSFLLHNYDDQFWHYLDELVSCHQIIIDRSKGTSHPRYPDLKYPVDYGYLKGTSSMDGNDIDVWLGSVPGNNVDAIICTIDRLKKDSEIKVLIGCNEDEKARIYQLHNASPYMKGILILRKTPSS